jgi:hypothetical protein
MAQEHKAIPMKLPRKMRQDTAWIDEIQQPWLRGFVTQFCCQGTPFRVQQVSRADNVPSIRVRTSMVEIDGCTHVRLNQGPMPEVSTY